MTLPPPLVGRNPDVAVLTELIDVVASGAGQAMIVEGEPGSGKTRLVTVAAGLATARRVRVLWGSGDEQLAIRPFALLAQVLARAGSGRGLTARGRGDRLPPATSTDEVTLAAVEEFVDRIEELASMAPTLLVVDDLDFVDGASLSVLAGLGRRLRYLSVGLIATARRPPRPPAVEQLIAALEGSGGWLHRLGPLSEADREHLVTLLTGEMPGARLRHHMAATGGNPLYLVELIRALDAEGRLIYADGTVDTDAHELPGTFRNTVLRRLGRTTAATTAVLQVAAVLGPRFSRDDVETLLDRPPDEVAAALAEGCRSGFLVEWPDEYAFSHSLMRDILYAELSPVAAKRLHRRYARLLRKRGAPTAEVAVQLALSAGTRDEEASSYLARAARELAGTDPSAAAALLRQAVSLRDDQPGRDALGTELATVLARLGEIKEAGSLAREILSRPHDAALDPSLRLVVGREHLANGRTAAALAEFETAGSTVDLSPSTREEALSRVALGWLFSGDLAAADAAARRVLDLGERLGDDAVVVSALCTLALLADCGGHIDEAVNLARRAVSRADASPGGHAHWFPCHLYLAYMLMDDDRLGEAAHMLRLGRKYSERLGVLANIPAYHFGHGVLSFLSGAWDTAVAELGAGLLATADLGSVSGLVWAQSVAAIIAVHSDDLAGASAALASADRYLHSEIQPFWHWSLWAGALLREAQGDLPGAAATMGMLVDGCVAGGSLYEVLELAPDLVRMSLAVGDRGRAALAVASVEKAAATSQRENGRAAVLRCRGILDGNAEMLVQAAVTYRAIGRAMHAAWAASEAASVMAATGRRSEASVVIADAMAAFEAAGARGDLARARALGLLRSRDGGRWSGQHDMDRLTPAQRKVAALVADGLTSAEIGRRLFISPRTVEGHLARMYTALGVHSRVELAMWFAAAKEAMRPS